VVAVGVAVGRGVAVGVAVARGVGVGVAVGGVLYSHVFATPGVGSVKTAFVHATLPVKVPYAYVPPEP
jgi:hypothetical protein